MTVNISSRNFALTIAGVDRTSELRSITLSQPSTLERRDAPVTGSITLAFNPLKYNEYITIGSPAIAANWAVGALVVFQTANDAGTLVNNLLSGGQLYILKEPSPPDISFNEGTLQLEVGCILAYQSQRTADRDVSDVTIGTSTDRDEIVVRVLEDAGITSHSIPSLGYPFNTPVQKSGGSPIKLAGDLVGADRHVLYCNASGTVIAAPIDIDATVIATLTIGSDEESFKPVDGSAIPTVTELTISGVHQIPDRGDYPILVITPLEVEYGVTNSSSRTVLTVGRNTLEITSENHSVEVEEGGLVFATFDGLETVMDVTPLIARNIKEEITAFDSSNRLSQKITRKYLRLYDTVSGLATTPFFEIERTIVDYTYATDYPSSIRTAVYTGVIPNSGNVATLYSLSRTTVDYIPNLPFWNQITSVETFGNNFDGVTGSQVRSITANGVTYQAFTTGNDRLPSNFVGATRTPKVANDGSTRPPAITYSEVIKTKNEEIKATINALPLAGVPSKEKFAPITVDWLTSNAQALAYGNLEIVLINGRKQCRFMVTALTDELLALRPRCRIDIVFNSILYRCLVDAIAFSQDLTRRTIGFMCDVISTSPVATPSTVYRPVTPQNAIRCIAQASPATVVIAADITLDVIFAQASPATAAINIGVNVSATITAQSSPATAIISISPLTLEAELTSYIAAYSAEGSSLAGSEAGALNNLIIALKSAGVWAKYAYLWIIPAAPSNLNSAAIYLKPYGDVDRCTLNNFVFGDLTINGIKGDGSTKYANSGVAANLVSSSTTSALGMHCATAQPLSTNPSDGAGDIGAGVGSNALYAYYSSFDQVFWYGAGASSEHSNFNTSANALFLAQLDNGASSIHKNDALYSSATVTGGSVSSANFFMLAINDGGTAQYLSDGRYSMFFVLDNAILNDTERDAQYAAYAAYASAIGRSL